MTKGRYILRLTPLNTDFLKSGRLEFHIKGKTNLGCVYQYGSLATGDVADRQGTSRLDGGRCGGDWKGCLYLIYRLSWFSGLV